MLGDKYRSREDFVANDTVMTPFGVISVHPQDQENIYVTTEKDGIHRGSREGEHVFIINGVPYKLSLHMRRYMDKWHIEGRRNWLTRADDYQEDASVAAYTKVEQVIPSIVTDWAENNEGLLIVANVIRLNNEVYTLFQKKLELAKQYDALTDDIQGCKEKAASLIDCLGTLERNTLREVVNV